MTKYSRMNRGYKYIFINIDVFSKYAYAFPIKSKNNQILNLVLKKFLKKENLNLFCQIKNLLFSQMKC